MAGAAAAGPGRPVQRFPRDAGYRSMCVFQGKSDRAPALYVSTMSRTGAVLLRSEDGKSFEPVCEPGFGDASIYSFRSLVEWNGWLFAAPAGTVSDGHLDRNLPPAPKIYASKDPLKGAWVEAAPPDLATLRISQFILFAGIRAALCGTANADLGLLDLANRKRAGSRCFTGLRLFSRAAKPTTRAICVESRRQ